MVLDFKYVFEINKYKDVDSSYGVSINCTYNEVVSRNEPMIKQMLTSCNV